MPTWINTQMSLPDFHRLRLFVVPRRHSKPLMEQYDNPERLTDLIRQCLAATRPELKDALILALDFDIELSAFRAMISDRSFDRVPEGEKIPVFVLDENGKT